MFPDKIMVTIFTDDVIIQSCKSPTNGVSYFTMVIGLPEMSQEMLSLVPLFSDIITK